MNDKESVISQIHDAFGRNEYPGDNYLLGSTDGCEPFEEVGPFKGKHDWKDLDPQFLDEHSVALSFFSEAGFRFFLPAFLIADLQESLRTADPVFYLTHGFSDASVDIPGKERVFVRRFGKSALLNPRRYGAMTWQEYARFRLSIFTREEAGAIVAYLTYRRDWDPYRVDKDQIDAALTSYWSERACHAPRDQDLRDHLAEEEAFVSAIQSDHIKP